MNLTGFIGIVSMITRVSNLSAVSYTHLDVYKRQADRKSSQYAEAKKAIDGLKKSRREDRRSRRRK